MVFYLPAPLQQKAQQLQIQLPDQQRQWTLAQIKQKVPVQQIKLFDPVYNSEKSFEGVSLLQLLKAAGYKQGQAADEVVLTASDGYAPSMPLEFLLDDQAVLVFAETGKKDFDFAPVATRQSHGIACTILFGMETRQSSRKNQTLALSVSES